MVHGYSAHGQVRVHCMCKCPEQHRVVLQEMGRKLPMTFNIISTRKFSVLSSDNIYCTESLQVTEMFGLDTRLPT